jgi:Ca2+-binding EF-hand superfamily protein
MATDEEQVAAAFDALDLDDTGEITEKNLVKLLGPGYDEEAIARMLAEGDFTANGTISLAELTSVMRGETPERGFTSVGGGTSTAL